MPRLILFHGDKGGTGKSFACSVFLDRVYKDKKYIAIDADLRNPDIEASYGQHMEVVTRPLTTHDEFINFFEAVESYMAKGLDVVVSLPSQAGDILSRETELLETIKTQLNFELCLVWIMNRQSDSIILLNEAMKTLHYYDQLLIIMNGYFGEKAKFTRWQQTALRLALLKNKKTTEVYLPELADAIVDKLMDPKQCLLPYSCATESTAMSMIRRIELNTWLKKALPCFDSLLPKPPTNQKKNDGQ